MYGTQTQTMTHKMSMWFENDVKMYGTQTKFSKSVFDALFENDVKMYGTQTSICCWSCILCLRMM